MNRKIIMAIVSIIAVISLALGISYAYFTGSVTGTPGTLTIKAGDLDIRLTNTKVNATLNEPIYSSDVDTKALSHTFTVTRGSNATLDGCYDLYLVIDNIGANLKNKFLKYRISDGTYTKEGNFAPSNITYVGNTGTIKIFENHESSSTSTTHTYTLKIWLSYDPVEDQTSILTGNDASRTVTVHLEASGTLGTCTIENTEYLTDAILKNKTIETREDFSSVYAENTDNKIFTTNRTDDDSTVYYYAGNTHNNWVIFGNDGNPTNPTYYYWRIIRTNSNEEGGGLRLLYSGSGSSSTTIPSDLTNGVATTSVYNSDYDKAEYVGYMYTVGQQHGHSTSSTIKTDVDSWYNASNLSSFESLINKDAVYCNDRSVATGTTWASTPSSNMLYASLTRLSSNKYPTHKCGGDINGSYYESSNNRLADKFSVTTNGGGNGYLSSPIGLMTADEVAYAGGVYAKNSPQAWYYLNGAGNSITGSTWWWLASSNHWDAAYGYARAFFVNGSLHPGGLGHTYVHSTSGSGVRPVISLKADVLISSGDGTTSSPYIVKTDYKELALNGAYPKLTDDLVPVTISTNGSAATVTYADIYEEWYNYEEHEWANAVKLVSSPSKTYNVGDTILESDIEGYFVWIPRYRYQLWNANQADGYITGEPATLGSEAREIQIVFENKYTTPSTGSSNNEWLTHPAFTSFNSNGFWTGKFETTGTTSGITVKPGITALRNQTVKTFFDLAYDYDRSMDSHMMKNTEWGAVAYLYHSAYGRCTNGVCEDIRINNHSGNYTGYASTDSADQSSYPGTTGTASTVTLPWYTTTGVKASTTGNISGVYDMSGGTHEYVAAYRNGVYLDSGFDASSIAGKDKYFDVYPATGYTTTYTNRILGDATGEMGPFYYYAIGEGSSKSYFNNWYSDYSAFVYSEYAWFHRGGLNSYGKTAGPFEFRIYTGGRAGSFSFRLVIVG